MPSYIAMLRGINVGGKKTITMDSLRLSFATLGFTHVKTYVQSGNIVFEAPDDGIANISKKIEQKILNDFGFSVPVFLRTPAEMERIIINNPFLQDSAIDHSKLHITFLSVIPQKPRVEQLLPLAMGLEQFYVIDREIYLYCPSGYGNTKLTNTTIEKKLAVGATTRNWTTTKTLLAMV